MGKRSISVVAVLLAALTARSPITRRIIRNAFMSDMPEPLAPVYPNCTDSELIGAVTMVITVKDTCGQADYILEKIAKMYPANIPVIYAYPNIRGCRDVPVQEIGDRLFKDFTLLVTGRKDPPIAGFLKAQKMLKTKYAVLMHNDAYPLESQFACELYRALEAHPEYPIAAPQIFEAGDTRIIVPHGHHENLHVRPLPGGKGELGRSHRIDYDLSMDLATARKPADFKEGPQRDFLEDHAFFGRADAYHELLDEGGSFTMEYMDMILNMRARDTSAWYVPTARCVFDVALDKLVWQDLPYFVYKRSEQIGHQVRGYLTNKWGVEFPNTGIWNYVRYVYLANIVMEGEANLPTKWEDQATVFYSWFESLGFNRYDGQYLPDFVEEPVAGAVNVSRTTEHTLSTEVPAHRVPPKSARTVLPEQASKSMFLPDISFKDPYKSIHIKMRECDAANAASYADCGMVVQDGDACKCWTYVTPYNLKYRFGVDKLMDLVKLPSRAFMFAQMKYFSSTVDDSLVDFSCNGSQQDCSLVASFPKTAKILKWSWFGEYAWQDYRKDAEL
eukprot:g7319.t1